MEKFTYPAQTTVEQVEWLVKKWLIIKDKQRAISFLDYIPYAKFYAYLYPYLDVLTNWKITWEQIENDYKFDQKLRLLFLEYVTYIELGIKSMFVNVSCNIFWGNTWRSDPQNFIKWEMFPLLVEYKEAIEYYRKIYNTLWCNFEKKFNKQNKGEVIKIIKHTIKETKDKEEKKKIKSILKIINKQYIDLYIERYNIPPYPPIWNIVEELTFWDIPYFLNVTHSKIKRRMLKKINISKDGLDSALKNLVDIRNVCCHHWRLYNRATKFHDDLIEKLVDEKIFEKGKEYKWFYPNYSLVLYSLGKINLDLQNNFFSKIKGLLKQYKKDHFLQV